MEKYLIYQGEDPSGEGTQEIYRFENNFGASVVSTPYSYGGGKGLYELAIIKFYGEECEDFDLTYSTPLSNDVIGFLMKEDVLEILEKIKNI